MDCWSTHWLTLINRAWNSMKFNFNNGLLQLQLQQHKQLQQTTTTMAAAKKANIYTASAYEQCRLFIYVYKASFVTIIKWALGKFLNQLKQYNCERTHVWMHVYVCWPFIECKWSGGWKATKKYEHEDRPWQCAQWNEWKFKMVLTALWVLRASFNAHSVCTRQINKTGTKGRRAARATANWNFFN